MKVWDRRALGGALHTFQLQEKPIMRVEWAPYRKGALSDAPFLLGSRGCASASPAVVTQHSHAFQLAATHPLYTSSQDPMLQH